MSTCKRTVPSSPRCRRPNPFATLENGVYPTDTRNDMVNGRIDHRFNDKHSLFVRYAYDDQAANGAQRPVRSLEGLQLGPNTSNDLSRSHSVVAQENWIVSGTTVNSLRVHVLSHQVSTVPNHFGLAISRPSFSWGQTGIAPQYFPRTVVSAYNTLYMNTARHDIKIGGDFTTGRYEFEAHFNENGLFSFTTDAPFDRNNSATWPFSFTQRKPGLQVPVQSARALRSG